MKLITNNNLLNISGFILSFTCFCVFTYGLGIFITGLYLSDLSKAEYIFNNYNIIHKLMILLLTIPIVFTFSFVIKGSYYFMRIALGLEHDEPLNLKKYKVQEESEDTFITEKEARKERIIEAIDQIRKSPVKTI